MKTACIYHSIDLDGWMSAAIVAHWFKTNEKCIVMDINKTTIGNDINSLTFIGYNYGQPIPNLSEYDRVIMCDISFPVNEMDNLNFRLRDNFIWIDHHISAIDSNFVSHDGIRDTRFAACELTWKYFFPNETMPEIVRLLGRYDCFGHKGTNEEQKVLEFQYGARQCISNYEEAYNYLLQSFNRSELSETVEFEIHETGKAIYQYLCTEAKQTYKNGFEVEFEIGGIGVGVISDEKFKFICINKERFNPINFGINYHKDGYDGAACFHYANGKWNFSLYNDNGLVDCSIIAKQFGGGGHKGAAGFAIKDLNEIIKTQ